MASSEESNEPTEETSLSKKELNVIRRKQLFDAFKSSSSSKETLEAASDAARDRINAFKEFYVNSPCKTENDKEKRREKCEGFITEAKKELETLKWSGQKMRALVEMEGNNIKSHSAETLKKEILDAGTESMKNTSKPTLDEILKDFPQMAGIADELFKSLFEVVEDAERAEKSQPSGSNATIIEEKSAEGSKTFVSL